MFVIKTTFLRLANVIIKKKVNDKKMFKNSK